MLVSIAKLGSKELLGQFALGLAVAAPVFMLLNLNLRAVLSTDAERKHQFTDHLGLRLLTSAIALVTVGFAAIWGDHGFDTMLAIIAVGCAKTIEAISDLCYGMFQQRERLDFVARSLFLRGPLGLVALSVVLLLTGSIVFSVLAVAAIWTFVLVTHDLPSTLRLINSSTTEKQSIRPRWTKTLLQKLVLLALPLGVVTMMISLVMNIPRYFVEHYLGVAELGVFSAMAYIIVAGNMVITSLGQSSSARLSVQYATGNRRAFLSLLGRLIATAIVFGVCMIGLGVLVGEPFLAMVYRPEYATQHSAFVWLMVAGAVFYVASFLGYGMTSTLRFKSQIPVLGAAVLAVVCCGWWLVPRFGLVGAAISLICAAGTQLVGSLIVVGDAVVSLKPKALRQ